MTKTFDGECLELALHFLSDEKAYSDQDCHDLAQNIQSAIEDWFFDKEIERGRKLAVPPVPRDDDPEYRQQMKDAGRGHLLR